MPVYPPSAQADGQNRLTQSPMATQDYDQQMMPPANNMDYMQPTSGKLGANQMPGDYSQYNSQYPQANYNRQQPNMGAMTGTGMSGPIQNYQGSQPSVYPNDPGQMLGVSGYSNMVRMIGQQSQGPGSCSQNNGNVDGLINSQYPGFSPHVGSMPGHYAMQQMPGRSGPVPPRSAAGTIMSEFSGQQEGVMPHQHVPLNKGAQAVNSASPSLSLTQGPMSPLIGQSGGGGSVSQINKTNSPGLCNSDLNSMPSSVEQLTRSYSYGVPSLSRGSASSGSSPPVISAAVTSNMSSSSSCNVYRGIPLMSTAATCGSLSYANSTTAAIHPDFDSTSGSDSSGGMTCDSTSVDNSFHSSDQRERASDSINIPTQPGSSLPGLPSDGDACRTLENISPPDYPSHHSHHMQYQHHLHQQPAQYQFTPESKVSYSGDGGVSLQPSTMTSMPSSTSSIVTTASPGLLMMSVTQSISSPVTSISTATLHNPPYSHPYHMGPQGGTPHMMGQGTVGMMPNGIHSSNMMNLSHIGGPNEMAPNIGGSLHSIIPGVSMNHKGPIMSGHPGMNMTQMPAQHQQVSGVPVMASSNSSSSLSDGPPKKKKKTKKSSVPDLSKLFEMGSEPDRPQFLEHIFAFLEERGQPVTALPVISKTPLDLYRLYFSVREKGGFQEVTRSKKWRDICTAVNIGTSASAAFTLKKNYIRYLFSYECKCDRGGIDPAPILAQMEAKLAQKREQKNKRAPSPGSNSSDSFRPPSVPNSQMDTSCQSPNFLQYRQNLEENIGNVSRNNMGSNSMRGPVPHGGVGSVMGGPVGVGPSGITGGPGSNMFGQQGMMIPSSGAVSTVGSQMMSGGPHGYGGPSLQQHAAGPGSSSVSSSGPTLGIQEPLTGGPGYQQHHGGLQQSAPPAPGSTAASTTTVWAYPDMQQTSTSATSTSSQPVASVVAYGGPSSQNSGWTNDPQVSASAGQLPFGQQFERPDRSDQGTPGMVMRPPGVSPSPQPQFPGEFGTPVYPAARFPGPRQSVDMRLPQSVDATGQYMQQGPPKYHGPYYPNSPQSSGPRMSQGPDGIYGAPVKRFPDDHPAAHQYSNWSNPGVGGQKGYSSAPVDQSAVSPDDRIQDGGHWSPAQGSHVPQGYVSAPPSSGPYNQQMSQGTSVLSGQPALYSTSLQHHQQQKAPPAYGGVSTMSITKRDVVFPPDSVESTRISTAKRKKMTSKDLAPLEHWKLMLALKSGMLAETTWALDTLNILLYDDKTHGCFRLNTLPGLLEMLTEHFRCCLRQMFEEFEDEDHVSRVQNKELQQESTVKQKLLAQCKESVEQESLIQCEVSVKQESLTQCDESAKQESLTQCEKSAKQESMTQCKESVEENMQKYDNLSEKFFLSGPNFTKVSRQGLPVRIDEHPADQSVLDTKEWDVYSRPDTATNHWSADVTDHLLTRLESDKTNKFLAGRFRRKRTRDKDDDDVCLSDTKKCYSCDVTMASLPGCVRRTRAEECRSGFSVSVKEKERGNNCVFVRVEREVYEVKSQTHEPGLDCSSSDLDHSRMCRSKSAVLAGGPVCVRREHDSVSNSESSLSERDKVFKSCSENADSERGLVSEIVGETAHIVKPGKIVSKHGVLGTEIRGESGVSELQGESGVSELQGESGVSELQGESGVSELQGESGVSELQGESGVSELQRESGVSELQRENGVSELQRESDVSLSLGNDRPPDPKLLPAVNYLECDNLSSDRKAENKVNPCNVVDEGKDKYCDSSPPIHGAECLNGFEDRAVEEINEPVNSTLNSCSAGTCKEADTSAVIHTFCVHELVGQDRAKETFCEEVLNDGSKNSSNNSSHILNESYVSETEELSAHVVANMSKEEDSLEEEAFQRDDPPLCVTPESRDELGRRCVCISNIIRSLSCVPGNEAHLCGYEGIMRVLAQLLLLHHRHPEKSAAGKMPNREEEEEDRQQQARVCDGKHWWWSYLDQLRENTLVILTNICGHLKLGHFPEQICFPFIEGLLHWVICPSSVARDPLPTLPPGSALSPQKLVLEALCKLCIHETNVDLLMATPPVRRLLELFSTLVHLLEDHSQQIAQEFSIVLLSLLVPSESIAARAVALLHPSVSLLVDFLETAEKNALIIANQQGLEVLQNNPEIMGTSLDMLRRAASILLHMARVPDNQKIFARQQPRLLSLVMSRILDRSVSSTLSEVLFECSQVA